MDLTASNKDYFLQRFHQFYDSVIRKVEITFRYHGSRSKAMILLTTRDAETVTHDGWVNVRLQIDDVTQFRCTEDYNTTYAVLSEAMHIWASEDRIFIDFGGSAIVSEEEKWQNEDAFRRSAFYFAGRTVTWYVEEYSENIS